MKTILSFILLAGFLAFSPAYSAELKIGSVDPVKLQQRAPQLKQALDRIEEDFMGRKRGLMTERQAIQEQQVKLQSEKRTAETAEQLKALEHRQKKLQFRISDYEDDLNARRREEHAALLQLLDREIKAYARQHNFDLILADDVVYASEQVEPIDITEQVLKHLEGVQK